MIITNLKGGLGNQIFQYATGRALLLRQNDMTKNKVSSKRNNNAKINISETNTITDNLKLDITGYSSSNGIDTLRHYALSVFNIKADIATVDEIKKIKYPFGIISKGWRYFRVKFLRQFNIKFVKRIYNCKGSIYLDGFFHSEKYFLDYENEIRKDLTLVNPMGLKSKEVSDKIKNINNSVSLHVRRGDYVTEKTTNKHHGTCSPEYYSKALDYIVSKIGNDINIFVFSDDIEWVKVNMPLKYNCTYVSSPEIRDYEELVLMSKCKNNIIANSSFSWWGAWLNQNRDKIVVTPSRWVMDGQSNYKDMIPETWHKI